MANQTALWGKGCGLFLTILCALPLSAHAFWGVNSLNEKNDLKFVSGLESANTFAAPNTTYARAPHGFNEHRDDADAPGVDGEGPQNRTTEVSQQTENKRQKSPAVVLLHSCAGLTWASLATLDHWKNLLTSQGFAVLVIDSVGPRDIKQFSNCWGSKRPIGKQRLVKDLFDAVAHLSAMPEIDSTRIFALGFSLGAMTAGIAGGMADDRSFADKPHPRAVAGLYGGCDYGVENWLESKSSFPILWLMGSADVESPPKGCMAALNGLVSQGIGSEWHLYEGATHCWDCQASNGFTKKAANGQMTTYLYDEKITRASEQAVLDFFEKFPTTLKKD